MVKIGDKIKIIACFGGHNYTIGKKYIITSTTGQNYRAFDPEINFHGNNLLRNEFEVFKDIITIEELNKEEKEILRQLKYKKFIKNYLEKENLEFCEDVEIRAQYLIELFESNDPNKKNELIKILNKVNNKIEIEPLNFH